MLYLVFPTYLHDFGDVQVEFQRQHKCVLWDRVFIALVLITWISNPRKCQHVFLAPYLKKKKKREGHLYFRNHCTTSVILMLQQITFLRYRAGESVRSRSQAHLQPAAAGGRSAVSAVLGVNAKHGKGRRCSCTKSFAFRLLQPSPT